MRADLMRADLMRADLMRAEPVAIEPFGSRRWISTSLRVATPRGADWRPELMAERRLGVAERRLGKAGRAPTWERSVVSLWFQSNCLSYVSSWCESMGSLAPSQAVS
jgi:hypothetical protein